MTRPKPPDDLRKRGRKKAGENDAAVWLAVEARRLLGGLGRARGSTSRAIQFVHQDMARNMPAPPTLKTVHNRYHRAAARRRAEPVFAAHLDAQLGALAAAFAGRGPGILLPGTLNPAKT